MTTTRVFRTATKLAGPEQLMGEDMTISTDVWAILMELFGGKSIWENISTYATMCQVSVKGIMPKTDHLPPSIQNIVKKCLCLAERRATAAFVLFSLCELQ